MSQDGGRRIGGTGPGPLEGPQGGEGGGGPHNRGHMKFPDAPIHFDALNISTGETVRIVEKRKDGIWLDAQSNEYKPHPHRLGVLPA